MLSSIGLIGIRGTRTSFFISMPDLLVVVMDLCVNAFANSTESGPIALVRRRLWGGPLIIDERMTQIYKFRNMRCKTS